MSVDTVSLSGSGRTAPTTAVRFRPRTYEEAADVVRGRGPRGAIARGLGRAPGDAAQNAGGSVLDMGALDRVRAFDEVTGTVVCDAGTRLDRLARTLSPSGWYLPVVPGDRRITVGGAIGSDVHGHDHRTAGSFTRHVTALELLTADGSVTTVLPGTPLFDATAGGLGLTGVVLSATLRCRRIATPLMCVDTERVAGLDDLLARMAGSVTRLPYESARIDLTARGRATGRAVLVRGGHAPLDALPVRGRREPLAARPGLRSGLPSPSLLPAVLPPLPSVPAFAPVGLLGRTAMGLVNEVRHRAAPRGRSGALRSFDAFFRSPEALPRTPAPAGRGGFVRYQFTVGPGREETLRRVVRRLSGRACPSSVAVLERLGAAGPGWLSFPAPGWSLAVDVPAGLPGVGRFLDGLDDEVAAAGGRVALARDARLRPELLAAMYPRLAEFRALRAETDPTGAFRSDLARRLAL
ncbi:FAD-binding oxidoreductase [Streptomyces sp. NBC_01218]|uniref:FAD-binding oxidoreductase n=1 Tax=unclassified Streptomyces TaxID=2593676 RepID=UPI002E0E534A|nr:FAD-binding oxidoreductase [Streptomyces sp. NBC_01218]